MTTAQEQSARHAAGPDPVVDRAIWERLRRAAYLGLLLPEGLTLLDQLHDLYPDWREEW
ncbi:hypothetical protein [Streptacidiphilus anmyonensis]|uniref:hypothetical protein n=1 Tax=Streptacidiphilus anmyonensis TaxID=405782 RepID=UPI000B2BFEED|nr:hypothetical protein [Streptacidiphilus anmyonensis]